MLGIRPGWLVLRQMNEVQYGKEELFSEVIDCGEDMVGPRESYVRCYAVDGELLHSSEALPVNDVVLSEALRSQSLCHASEVVRRP
jgi:hypothetical protein